MEWSTRRRLAYVGVIVVSLSIFGVYFFRDTFFKQPTCSDGLKNGFEVGVDCGGTCSLKCTEEVVPLVVKWSRPVQTSSTTYDLVAMIVNKNIDNSAHGLSYAFTLYNKEGKNLGVITGSTTPQLGGEFPIIVQGVSVTSGALDHFVTSLTDQPHFTVTPNPETVVIKTVSTRYEPGRTSRVYAVVANTKQVALENIPVRVILYDKHDNAYAVSETVIPYLNKEEITTLPFTWPFTFMEAPTKILVYPILDPFNNSRYQ